MKIDLFERHPQYLVCKDSIEKTISIMFDTYKSGGTLMFCGNGGSCADCDHIVGELMKGFLERREPDNKLKKVLSDMYPNEAEFFINNLQKGIPAVSLAAHSGVMTAFANDVSADMIYAQMVYAYGRENDTVIGITTSGNSKNVVYAMKIASAMGLRTIGLTGKNQCILDNICDCVIHAPESETYKVQECHLPIYHYICAKLEDLAMV